MTRRLSLLSLFVVAITCAGVLAGCRSTDPGTDSENRGDRERASSEKAANDMKNDRKTAEKGASKKKDDSVAGDVEVDGTVVHRVNAGAPEELTFDGETWAADQVNWTDGNEWGASGGNTVYRGDLNIVDTMNDRLYRYERWGVPSYTFNVENGAYAVRLHFAENYHGVVKPGGRIFGVHIEGEPALEKFDVYRAASGRNKAVIRTIRDVKVEDGTLEIKFQWNVHQPFINGIEVIRTDG